MGSEDLSPKHWGVLNPVRRTPVLAKKAGQGMDDSGPGRPSAACGAEGKAGAETQRYPVPGSPAPGAVPELPGGQAGLGHAGHCL